METVGEDFFNNWGTCLMSAPDMTAAISTLPEPKAEDGPNTVLIAAGATSAVLVLTIVLWLARRRCR